ARAPPRPGRCRARRRRPPRIFARTAARARVRRRLTARARSNLPRPSCRAPGSRAMAVSIPTRIVSAVLVAAGIALAWRVGGDEGRVLDAKLHHLGGDVVAHWQEQSAPEPAPLRVAFESRENPTEWVLEFAQRDVGDEWALAIDGKVLGTLQK